MTSLARAVGFVMGFGAWIGASKFRAIVFVSVVAVMIAVAG
jgi:hypothetical protein